MMLSLNISLEKGIKFLKSFLVLIRDWNYKSPDASLDINTEILNVSTQVSILKLLLRMTNLDYQSKNLVLLVTVT